MLPTHCCKQQGYLHALRPAKRVHPLATFIRPPHHHAPCILASSLALTHIHRCTSSTALSVLLESLTKPHSSTHSAPYIRVRSIFPRRRTPRLSHQLAKATLVSKQTAVQPGLFRPGATVTLHFSHKSDSPPGEETHSGTSFS